ncbi:hypothetical protein [Spiroplasma endosymbiont of Panzeria rudis]|uniref:hypothetical protein n=1 Tax=Spiroplasma endosymbiont of Panzeria rudis TaxID=3066301 RepID=UPI0030CAEABF
MISEHLTNLNKLEQEQELFKFSNSIYADDFCKNYLIKIYLSYLKEIDFINFLVPHSNESIESWFFNFLIHNKTNDEWLRYYHDNKGPDILRPSLKKIIPNTFLKQPITEKFSKVHNIDSEIRWFNESTHYLSIPIIIRKNYILKEYIGTTKEQGRLNGPDFILENINNKKTLGLEIVELNPVLFVFPNGVRDFEKVGKKLDKQINEQKGGNFYRNWINLIKIVEDKINKWKKFQKTDEKAIGIILNNSVPDIWYYIFEISLKFSKFNNEIDYFFIL